MTIPTRVQRRRTAGFTLPPNTKCCTRPGKWGNPFETASMFARYFRSSKPCMFVNRDDGEMVFVSQDDRGHMDRIVSDLEDLRQYDHLACWCPLGADCHVDVLIELLREGK